MYKHYTGPVSGSGIGFVDNSMYVIPAKKCKIENHMVSPARFYRCDTEIAGAILRSKIAKTIIHETYLKTIVAPDTVGDARLRASQISTHINENPNCVADNNIIHR